jgi:uncharacterized protein YhbP (UPF0306 family)
MFLARTELEITILEELERHTVLTLATSGKEGPHAVSLMYAHDGFNIYWLSDPKAHHSGYLASCSSASVTIASQHKDFRDIRGLQMDGEAYRISDTAEEATGFRQLVARYPFLEKFGSGKLARHLGAAAVYVFRPTTMTLIDNTRGFGFKQTLAPQEIPNEYSSNNP